MPAGKLPPRDYKAFDRFVSNLGGKWTKRAAAHVFTTDPRPLLAEAIGNGVARDKRKDNQAFFTPPEVVNKVMWWADVERKTVLEPSAGHGALADACRAAGARRVEVCELDQASRIVLMQKGYQVLTEDFLKLPTNAHVGYSRVVMNPPFARDQDIRHVKHAMKFLETSGRLVAIMMGHPEERPKLKAFIDEHGAAVERLERGAFAESGTDVPTSIVVVQRRRV